MNARQRRWRGAVAASLVLAAAGLFDRSGGLLLAAAVPLVYVGAGALSQTRIPEGLQATRRVEPTPAPPGRAVAITLTVRNDSEVTVPDLRVADGVPGGLAVLEGSPRAGVTLEPGEEHAIRYVVAARRGEHDFRPPHLRVRGLVTGTHATTLLSTEGNRQLVCRLDADAPPLDERGAGRVGRLASDEPGQGVTFHSTREYHPEDPADRIDWRQYAKRGELATTNYERAVSATVVLAVDARERNRVVAGPGRPTAVEIGAYAATHALSDLLGRGHDVGVAVLGVDGDGPERIGWLPPAGGRRQRARGLAHLREAADATGPSPPGTAQARALFGLLPRGAQLVFVSPLLDDRAVETVETWRAAGASVTVLSPDVLASNTVAGQYATVRRRTRLARIRSAGARTVDWRRGAPLPVVLAEAFAADARLSTARRAGRAGGRRSASATSEPERADGETGGDGR